MSTQALIRAQWARDDEATANERRDDEVVSVFEHLRHAMAAAELGELIRLHALVSPLVSEALDTLLDLMAQAIVDDPADPYDFVDHD